MNDQTRAHVLAFEDPEALREHLAEAHPVYVVSARWMDHREMDNAHIAAHRITADGTGVAARVESEHRPV